MQGLHRDRIDSIEATVTKFSAGMIPLMGVAGAAEGRAFAEQLVSSMRRVDYVRGLAARDVDARRNDASHPLFDPLMAAALAVKRGDVNEAWWLTFLATHFGKHIEDGWRLTRDFYGAFGTRPWWTWAEVSRHQAKLNAWLDGQWLPLLGDGIPRRFSNHRKYESKAPAHMKGVLGSYIELVTAQEITGGSCRTSTRPWVSIPTRDSTSSIGGCSPSSVLDVLLPLIFLRCLEN
jgi:hypothetical protein